MTRRELLARGLVAGAALFAAGEADARPDPQAWALLSDTHIAADRATINRGVNMFANLTAVTKELAALPDRPTAALVNGDCAYLMGEAADYAAFAERAQQIRAAARLPLHLTLGNHDHREHIRAALREAGNRKREVPDKLVSVVRSPRANWFLLDSLDQTNVTPGLLGEAQRKWLAEMLDRNASKPAIVVGHHDLEGQGGSMKDGAELLALLAPRKQVKAYIYGHTHDWHVTQHPSGIHLVNLPPVAYAFQPGKPSGWVLATLQPDSLSLRLSALDKAHPQHGQTLSLTWRTS